MYLERVDVPHGDVRDCGRICRRGNISGQRPDTHATRMVAISVFDEEVLRGRLHANAFIAVGDFEVMNVAIIRADEVDAICTADVWTSDRDVVCF